MSLDFGILTTFFSSSLSNISIFYPDYLKVYCIFSSCYYFFFISSSSSLFVFIYMLCNFNISERLNSSESNALFSIYLIKSLTPFKWTNIKKRITFPDSSFSIVILISVNPLKIDTKLYSNFYMFIALSSSSK